MDDLQFSRLLGVLIEMRDDQRRLIQLMSEPLPEPPHVHEPADGSPASAPFWVCKCGYVHDDEKE